MQFDQASSEEHRRHTEAMLGTLNRQVRARKECEKRAAELEKGLAVEQLALTRAIARERKRERFMYTDAKFAKILAAEKEQYRVQARAELSISGAAEGSDDEYPN